MAVYFGVVKDNRVELEEGARLRDGARVEIRPVEPEGIDAGAADSTQAERVLVRDLMVAGVLDRVPVDETASDEPFEPVTVRGRPLSEQIIDERR